MLKKDDVVDEAYEPTEREPRTAIFLFLRMSPGICEVAGRGRREEGREGRARGGGCSSGGYKHAIGIHGFVLVYSVTSRNSFDMIQIIYDKIINFCGIKEIPCVIVGSKTDLQQR